jgi:hypothetical protein
MQRRIVLVLALVGSIGCAPAAPPAPLAASPGPTAVPVVVASSPPSASAAPSVPIASAAPVESAPPASATAIPSGWTRYTHKRLGVSFAYPKATFRLSETPTGVTLLSALARDELGGDPHPKKWVWSLRVIARDADVKAVLKKDAASWYDTAFPKGVLDPENGSIAVARVAGLDGYRLTAGVEGYDSNKLFLARGPRSTIVLTFDTIGDVMGPSPTEEEQTRVFAMIEGSIQILAR